MSTHGATSNSRQSLDVAAATAKIAFQDPASARHYLQRVTSSVCPGLAGILPSLIAEVPDPDTAVLLLDNLLTDSAGEAVRALENHNVLAHYALALFGHSRYLGETLLRNPELLHRLKREKSLDRSLSREDFEESLARYRTRATTEDSAGLLAQFKRSEYVRIALRDILRIAPLAETTAEISALSDVLLEAALRDALSDLQRRYGVAQHLDSRNRLASTPFTILSLGKLGGNELNYSSDIDLLYIFGDGPETPNASITNKEYFARLAQQVTDILSRITPEGPVFRIDLRLRPRGNEGELAVSLDQALSYYSSSAEDWERQALIKVRHSAGDPSLARAFIRAVQPHVYTEDVNFAAIKTALVSREKIRLRRKRPLRPGRAASINIKLDHGGIRDIEFLVQCLQRVYGGAEPWLRSGGTLFSLQKLHDKGHITGREFQELTRAYDFLRQLEHRLQLRWGQQVHQLPSNPADLRIIARAMNRLLPAEDRFEDLTELVKRRMAGVVEIYDRVIYQQQSQRQQQVSNAEFKLRALAERVADATLENILDRLASDSPDLHKMATSPDLAPQARRNLSRFLSSAFTSSDRYAAVLRHPRSLQNAIPLFAASDYLTDILVRYPEEIATLETCAEAAGAGAGTNLFGRAFPEGVSSDDPVLQYLQGSSDTYSEKLSLLRKQYRHRLLAAGVRDLVQPRDVYYSLRANTVTADAVIRAAAEMVGNTSGLCIFSLGRLGSCEFDLLSDADLLFVCEENADRSELTRTVEQIMHALAAYTRDGTVFPVDTRLRPHGAEGELLVSENQLHEYFLTEAQPWEALMYTKLRLVAGPGRLADRAIAATHSLFQRFAGDMSFATAVREMRHKLEPGPAGEPSLKTSAGGAYDIDFLTGYLLIRNGADETRGTLRDRLWRCVELKGLDKSDATDLDHAAELYRTVEHAIRLVIGRTEKSLPAAPQARNNIERLTGEILHRQFPGGLQAELYHAFDYVRSAYEKIVA